MDSTHGPFVDGRSYKVSEMDTKAVHIGRRPKCRRYPSIGREVPKAQRRLVALEASRLKAGLLNEISIRPTLTHFLVTFSLASYDIWTYGDGFLIQNQCVRDLLLPALPFRA